MPREENVSFSDHICFIDESGDHSLESIDPNYPIFVLVLCLFKREVYIEQACKKLQGLKFDYWGHDQQVLHEHEIRKPNQHYSFLFDPQKRGSFLSRLNQIISSLDFKIITAVINKIAFKNKYPLPKNPYELSLEFCLERLYLQLNGQGLGGATTPVVIERRGRKEDSEIELCFRRICSGANATQKPFLFNPVMSDKVSNCDGLQIADLIARPIGLSVLRPTQSNRAYELIKDKFRRSPAGEAKGWGLKVFP